MTRNLFVAKNRLSILRTSSFVGVTQKQYGDRDNGLRFSIISSGYGATVIWRSDEVGDS